MSPLWAFLIEKYSWQGCCIIQAGISLQLVWIALLTSECPFNKVDTETKPVSWDLLSQPVVWTFALGCTLYYASYSVLNLFVPYVQETLTDSGLLNTSLIISLQTAVEVISRPVFGFFISGLDNPNNTLLFALAALLLAISLLLFYFVANWTMLIIFSVLQGAAFAFCGGLPTGLREQVTFEKALTTYK